MPIEVDTRDCTALSDAEIEEMADLCASCNPAYGVGMLSKQAEAWVLVSRAFEGTKLKGFSFCTLERIGGTPSVLIGLASVGRTSKRDQVLRAVLADQLRRAVLAFPDEDVLVATQIADPAAYDAFKSLDNVVPRPGHKANGEERAWGRRLAKRFGIDTSDYDDRRFVARIDGVPCLLDHESSRPDKLAPDVVELVAGVDADAGESLIVFGWAMAEDLLKLAP